MMARLSRSMTLTAVLAVVLAAGRPALAQGFDFRALLPSGLITGAVPSSTEVPSAPPWSGETGASGHPAMQAEAIRAAAAGFHDCLDRLASEAAHRGISRAEFDRQTAVWRRTCGSWICSIRSPNSPNRSGIISRA